MRVVTWQAPGGFEITVCADDSKHPKLPLAPNGQEYCSVSWGEHNGICQLCPEPKPEPEEENR